MSSTSPASARPGGAKVRVHGQPSGGEFVVDRATAGLQEGEGEVGRQIGRAQQQPAVATGQPVQEERGDHGLALLVRFVAQEQMVPGAHLPDWFRCGHGVHPPHLPRSPLGVPDRIHATPNTASA
ncbi:hypothetical protein [Streptomyces sp. NPDC058656]|uniref:hypothetical protein n=1 Tax=Streptomyces sp. NPDC058656 TaxID=3346578 RepID=UPI003660B82B